MSDFKAPPSSLNAEQGIVGGLLIDNGAIDRIGELKAEAFYHSDNRYIYEQIIRLIAQQKPADVFTVFDALAHSGSDVTLAYLNQVSTAVPSAANVNRYADIVREKALMRGLLTAAGKVNELVACSTQSATYMLDAAQAEFGKLAESTVRKEPVSIQEAMTEYLNDLDERFHGKAPNPGIPTGLTDLDELLNGGLRRGALITVGARPGMGKSAFGETIACNVSDAGYSALFLSMEMPQHEVTERAVANWGRVSASALAAADSRLNQDSWERITVAATKASTAVMFIDDQPGLSLIEVLTKARAIKRKKGLDVLIVDYLQLMVGTEEKRYQQIEAITKGLKILAKTMNIAVIALSQFSRDIEKRPSPKPKSSDFRDGGSIEQDSDVLIGLYREEQDKPDTPYKGMAELFLLKNRQGKTGSVYATYIGEYMRFENHTGAKPDATSSSASQRRGFQGA